MARKTIRWLMIVGLALLVLAPETSAWGSGRSRHFRSGHRLGHQGGGKFRSSFKPGRSRHFRTGHRLGHRGGGKFRSGFRSWRSRHFSSGHLRGGTRSHSIVNRRFRQNLSRHQFHRRKFRLNRFHRRRHFGHHSFSHRRSYGSLYFGYYHGYGGSYFSNRVWVPGRWVETQDGYWVWELGYWRVISPR